MTIGSNQRLYLPFKGKNDDRSRVLNDDHLMTYVNDRADGVGAVMTLGSDYSHTGGANLVVEVDTIEYDRHEMCDTTAHTITIPENYDGLYIAHGGVQWPGDTVTRYRLYLDVNGAARRHFDRMDNLSVGSFGSAQGSTPVHLVAGDVAKLMLYILPNPTTIRGVSEYTYFGLTKVAG